MPNTRTLLLTDRQAYIVLDVNPQEVTVNYANDVKSYDLVGGEYVASTKPKAVRVGLSTFIPHDGSDFRAGWMSQQAVIGTLERWRDQDTPVYFSFDGILHRRFHVENFSKRVREGDRDIYITLDLAEWRELRRSAARDAYLAGAAQKAIRYHTTRSGDTLVKLAAKYNVRWDAIYAANRAAVGIDPNVLQAGKRLVIPYD